MVDVSKIKIVYMGTPEFAVPAMIALAEAGYDLKLAVTQPDKARDRGKHVQFTPVKQAAIDRGIPVEQPARLKDNEEFFAQLAEIQPDVIIVAAYGKILPKRILDLPKFGCINIHGSLLPKYRGAAPIQRCILDGAEETGVTIMYMEEGLDTGAMLAKVQTPVDRKTGDILHDELAELGANLLLKTLPEILTGTILPETQIEDEASYAPMISKAEGEINFNKSAEEVERLVRGMNSWPSAFTYLGDKQMKIWGAEILKESSKEPPGTVLKAEKEELLISCGTGIINVTRLQLPGKKAVDTREFLKGNRIDAGTKLRKER